MVTNNNKNWLNSIYFFIAKCIKDNKFYLIQKKNSSKLLGFICELVESSQTVQQHMIQVILLPIYH